MLNTKYIFKSILDPTDTCQGDLQTGMVKFSHAKTPNGSLPENLMGHFLPLLRELAAYKMYICHSAPTVLK